MVIQRTCKHYNSRYGRCLLPVGHDPVDSGGGIFYKHMYTMRGALGNLDVREGMNTEELQNYQAKHRKDE